MTYAKQIYEHSALLTGRDAARARIQQALRDGTADSLALSFFVAGYDISLAKIMQTTREKYPEAEVSDHELYSFAAGFIGTIIAFARLRLAPP